MILLFALLAGILTGIGIALWQKRPWRLPTLRYLWLIILAFLPQFVAIYLPLGRAWVPDYLTAIGLVFSQTLLLVFCGLNWRVTGIWPLAIGTALNLIVITSNGGFMPISPQTAGRLIASEVVQTLEVGSRFGYKDILLLPEDIRFIWLCDRFLPPQWFPYQVAFSPGDIFIAVGAFWLTVVQGKPFLCHTQEDHDVR